MGRGDRWALTLGFTQAFGAFTRMAEGTTLVDDALERELTLAISSLQVELWAPTGTSLVATLPYGGIHLSDQFDSRTATGLADMPIVIRQDLARWLDALHAAQVRLLVGVGFVAPTGEVVKPGSLLESNRDKARRLGLVRPTGESIGTPVLAAEVFNLTASLGRGSWWMLGEVLIQWAPETWVSLSAQARVQGVVAQADSHIDWGEETTTDFGASFRPGLDWLVLRAGLQHEWRAQSHDDYSGTRLRLDSSGGHWLYATPGVALTHDEGASLSLGARLPIWRDVNGFQLVPTWTVNASLQLRIGL